jgi:hypothetical protein
LFIPGWNEYGEPRQNYTDRGKPTNSEKSLSQCHTVHHKSHMDWTSTISFTSGVDTYPKKILYHH